MAANDTIQFYTNPMSRARIAHWMLEEVGAPYEPHVLSFEKAEHKTPAFLAINPLGKLPTIVHRGMVVTECGAILSYLADAFPKAGLAPEASDPARGTYFRWLYFGAGCVEPALLDKGFQIDRSKNQSAVGYGTYEGTFNALEKALAPGPFLLGEKFSAADVYIGSEIWWGLFQKTLDPRPVFRDYLKRCEERPAYQRMGEQTKEQMAQLKR